MARIVVVTGGCRSGKSVYAQKMAEALPGRRAFIATCPPIDEEMKARIQKHQEARCRLGWETIEEPIDLPGVLRNSHGYEVLLIDCLTLWINNLMYRAGQEGCLVEEHTIERRCQDLLTVCSKRMGTIIFVTNEVGMGIVPEDPVTRRYRDLVGRCNRAIAEGSDTVFLMVCGIPTKLKG